MSSRITAECGKPVSLHCNTSSPQHGLSVKRMEWSQGNMALCSVDSQETMTTMQRHFQSDFHCEYKDRQLSLVFQSVLPLESGNLKPYRCKLHSNKGVAHNYTKVQLQGQSLIFNLSRQMLKFLICFLKAIVINV